MIDFDAPSIFDIPEHLDDDDLHRIRLMIRALGLGTPPAWLGDPWLDEMPGLDELPGIDEMPGV